MAHFAQLDENNTVLQVLVIGNDDTSDENGNEVEAIGVEFCKSLFGSNTIWKQTSYNTKGGEHLLGGTPFRKNYAAIGFKYDETLDAFIPPKPFPSWTLNEDTCLWEAPIPMPTDDKDYIWNEENQTWDEINDE